MKAEWSDAEKKQIAAVVWPMVEMQKAYGRKADAKLIMRGWQAMLSDKYNADQICYALKKYALEYGDDFPSPKNLNDILNPPKPKVTESQFIAAQKAQERNGYPQFSPEAYTIREYHQQNAQEEKTYVQECDKIAEITKSAIRRVGFVD